METTTEHKTDISAHFPPGTTHANVELGTLDAALDAKLGPLKERIAELGAAVAASTRKRTGTASLLDAARAASTGADGKLDPAKAMEHIIKAKQETIEALRKEGAAIPTTATLTIPQVVGLVVAGGVLGGLGTAGASALISRRRAAQAAAAAPTSTDTSPST